ncbi:hypothetical protein D1B31_04010 [Neobacillus notoginsengisoli]|uniref:Uncharacterized protein n=1 Tax=Neobacillus notoginsengisoli TaxID=1578198 RepID=A0A417YYE4_9BACI|nr:hypothetical protein D1B31_04010 [Neobacillus notoginsengisoli]
MSPKTRSRVMLMMYRAFAAVDRLFGLFFDIPLASWQVFTILDGIFEKRVSIFFGIRKNLPSHVGWQVLFVSRLVGS